MALCITGALAAPTQAAAAEPEAHGATARIAAGGGGASLAKMAERTPATEGGVEADDGDATIEHKGFVFAPRLGTVGCTGAICSGDAGHGARPGLRAGAFIGGNIGGFVELGLEGAWGRFGSAAGAGDNALGLYGFGPDDVPDMAGLAGFDYADYDLTGDARLSDARVGPAVRVHFVPRGRVAAWIGSGFGYHLFRGNYVTNSGDARISFHGFDVPAQAGVEIYVNRTVAFGAQFDYQWTRFLAVGVQHSDGDLVAPLGVLERELERRDLGLIDRLPSTWSASLGLRLTL